MISMAEAKEKKNGRARPRKRRAYARQRFRCPIPEPLTLKNRMDGFKSNLAEEESGECRGKDTEPGTEGEEGKKAL